MTPVEKDDFAHALGQTLKFYNKPLEGAQFSFWYQSMQGFPIEKVKRALLEYVKIGKYAPKPVDVIDLITASNEPSRKPALPAPEPKPYDPEIAKAWMWFIGRIAQGSQNLDGIFESKSAIPEDLQERYLHILNHEAHRAGEYEAIPNEYKLPEVWGETA